MKILAVDTALGACSAAVLDGQNILGHRLERMDRGHAERVAPMVREVMETAGIGFGAIDRLGVTTGPGTFTGQRVGLAFMRGLRIALKRPLIGITTLEAMLAGTLQDSGLEAAAILHDARRDEVYCAASLNARLVVPVCLLRFEAAVALVWETVGKGPLAVGGTAGEKAAAAFRALGGMAHPTGILQPDALWVARLAIREPERDGAPSPLYLRPPDARLPAQQ
ncbi:MAG TPA: tRNA (adenosine(37)-N6)-threonylcarbamoyltransferase complex dimerization subunit type 1 TsaB [Rhizomicrobium sp.]